MRGGELAHVQTVDIKQSEHEEVAPRGCGNAVVRSPACEASALSYSQTCRRAKGIVIHCERGRCATI